MTSLGDHVGVVASILGVVFFLLMGDLGIIYRSLISKLDSLEGKIDKAVLAQLDCQKSQFICQKSLLDKFVSSSEFNDFRKEFRDLWTAFTIQRRQDWAEMWAAFNKHGHEEKSGEVIRRG